MVIVIVGALGAINAELARALNARGHRVTAVDPSTPLDQPDQLLAWFVAAASESGTPVALVRIGVRPEQLTLSRLVDLDREAWRTRTEQPLREALAFHQAAAHFYADRAGRVVVVVPTTALTGAAEAVALATTADAERALVKSQSRALGRSGGSANRVTVNCVAVTSALLAGRSLDRAGLQPESLPPPTIADLAATIDGLLAPSFDAVTGQTIAVDGGRWTAP